MSGSARSSMVAWPWSYLLWRPRADRSDRIGLAGASRAPPGDQRPAPASRASPAIGGSGHARATSVSRGTEWGMRRLSLLGGSPLDMATPPSPSSLCGRDHANVPGTRILPGGRPGSGPSPGRNGADRGGYRASHGPGLPPRSRGIPDRDRRLAARRTCPRAGASRASP